MVNDMSRFDTMTLVSVRCVAIALILGLSGVCTLVNAQSTTGFFSIDCGYSNSSYVDNSTTLKWVNDADYTLTGTNGELDFAVKSNVDNFQALQTFRYFPKVQRKYCYDLPNQLSNGSFLLRAMFLHGNSSLLGRPLEFNVYVGNTKWVSVEYSSNDYIDTLTTAKVFESIFYSAEKTVHFCLVPVTGVPFISSLELRPFVLDEDSFENQTPYQYLWSILQWNTGAGLGARSQRFPDDTHDRIWTVPDSVNSYIPTFTNPTIYNSYGTLTNVLRDAWLNDNPHSSFVPQSYTISYDGLEYRNLREGVAYFYFWEISPNATSSTVRKLSVNVYNESHLINVTEKVVIQPVSISSLRRPLNFSVTTQPSSTLGPLLNAIAVYAIFDFDNSTTAANDVGALQSLQRSLDLPNGRGDPCLPVTWDWVDCVYNSSTFTSRVNKLLLSDHNISGTIPTSILQMDALTEIHLDNNNLSGQIPDGLVDLSLLTVLSLDNNNLSGEVPAGLFNKGASFNFTYSGNSLLAVGLSPNVKKGSKISAGVVVGSIVAALLGLLLMGVLTWYVFFGRRKKAKRFATLEPSCPGGPRTGYVPLEMILVATNNYAKQIGTGSFGSVYHGVLHGKEVAVKMTSMRSDQRNHEFINEVDILTRVHHKNLVSLIGYCNEGEQLILIYKYQSNGTLREWLRDKNKPQPKFLDWPQRLQIAVDAAKGLKYLHKDCTPSIIHRDVKSSNILLGKNLVGKVSDFGISKTTLDRGPDFYDEVHTAVKGTFGYLDPEYQETSILTQKSDVYSFGVVLAELISARPPFRVSEDGFTHDYLVDDLQEFAAKGDFQLVADPRLEGKYDVGSMWRVADIALTCLRRKGDERPDMTAVVRNLEMAESGARERRKQFHSSLDAAAVEELSQFSNRLR